jgi:hypothetical protein
MGKPFKSPGRQQREERERKLRLKHKYEKRITIAKIGKHSLDSGDFAGALKHFLEYLHIMAEIKEVDEIYDIQPKHFTTARELTEMLMISHIYFELARLYDAIPKFHDDCRKCLKQFVLFSANQPYQVVNSEMIRKHLKKSHFKLPEDFRFAYQQIYVQSKKCYVVTFCYGDQHPVTAHCREFKDWLLERDWGFQLVRYYYQYSSPAVTRWESSPSAQLLSKLVLRPLLLLFSKAILPLIIK